MYLGLKGKVAIVGGASRGLGYACAEALASEGVDLAICSRDEAAIGKAAATLREATGASIEPYVCDQRSAADISQLVEGVTERSGRIDILVNNTGGPPAGTFADHDDAAWQDVFDGLLMSVVRLSRAVLPGMRERGWGRIITNTSFTVKEPADRLILSNSLRTAVVGLSKTLSREVAADGITVNCICPGAFDTERLHALFESEAAASGRTADEVCASWEARIPVGRIAQPKELGALVAFLCSEQAGSITGGCYPIEGGMLRSLF